MSFKLHETGAIVGHGITIPADEQVAPGVILIDLTLLNRLIALVERDKSLDKDRLRYKTQDARRALADDLGLDIE